MRDDALPSRDQPPDELEAICKRFESAWKRGERIAIEDLLPRDPDLRQKALFELVSIELELRQHGGEAARREDYFGRFPELATRPTELLEMPREFTATQDLTRKDSNGSSPLNEGDRLGHFRILRMLGEGGMGRVYLAEDEELQKRVAIKVPNRKLFRSAHKLDRFLAEARTASQLKHPGIVPVRHFGRLEDGGCYIVMEYIEGQSLEELLKRGLPTADETAGMMFAIAPVVAAIHKCGYVHRDLKPGNILIDAEGTPHVADFGLALHETAQPGRAGERSGTARYMAPEQVEGKSHWLDGRADLWALGVIFYEMLTGRHPFNGANRDELFAEILHRDPKPPRSIREDVPVELERICLKCLAKPPAERYATADDLIADLRRWRQPQRMSLKMLVAATVLVAAIIGTTARFWPGSVNRSSKTAALSGQLDLLVWNKTDRSRQGLSLSHPEAMPLRDNDLLRVNVDLNRPAFVYLVWIDSKGAAVPVYPWEPGKWLTLPVHQSAVQSVNLPSAADEGWPIREPGGMETLLLLAREEPLPGEFDFDKLLAGLPPLPMLDEHSIVWFHNGKIVTKEKDQTRGLGFEEQSRIDNAVLKAQRQIQERLGHQFPLIEAVSVASRGG